MKAIFYNSFIEKIKQLNNIEIKNFSIGDTNKKYKLYSIWEPEKNLLHLSILFNSTDENKPDLSEVTKIFVYYAIFDQESNEENIAFILQNEDNSNLNLNQERNIFNVRFGNNITVKSKLTLNTPELNSDGSFLEGCGVEVGVNLFRDNIEDTDIVSRDSYYKLIKSNLTNNKIKGPDSSTGLDSTGKNISIVKYRKVYKEDSFVLGVFDETNYINISDEIKTKYNLPREIGYDSILSNESDKGAYRSVKLTGSIDYDLYYISDTGLVYINSGSDEITGIDGIRIVNIETGFGFTYEVDNLLYNINYFTPEGVDTDDPLINPYGIFVLELTYTDLNNEVKTIRSNKLRLIQGGYYSYFNVISRDSNYFYPKDDSAMYLFGRKKGERKNFTIRVKSPIFSEYWEEDDISKIKSDISFEFENEYMEKALRELFNFSFTIEKIEDLEDVFDIEVEILTLKDNNDPDHWLPYCDPDGDGTNESTLSLIKLNVDLDTTVNLYFERFYCAQGNQANNILLSDVNSTSYERSLVNSKDGLIYRNEEDIKTLSITEEYDNDNDIELNKVPFYWKVIAKPEELVITPSDGESTTEITKGEGEFNKYVVDSFKTGDKTSILKNKFNLKFDYNKFLGTYELPEYLTLIKLTQEEYVENIDIQDTWETFLAYNILKLPVRKEGVRPYVKIEGAVLNSRGNEVVLNLNTNPIRVEKIKVDYNATIQVKITSDSTIDDGRYKFWDGENEVDSITLTNISGEEESNYIYLVIKEVGKFSRDYTGAKIVFEYTPLATVESAFRVNSEDNLTTYIKLTEEDPKNSTYSVKFTEFKFNEEPGLGKGIGFAQRVLAGYKNDKGDWIEPNYDTLNYISNTPNQSTSTICDVFIPFIKATTEEGQESVPAFEARFKSSVSYELNIEQNISQFDLETGSVFGVNDEGDYEFKYHFIKFTNKELFRDTLTNYPAAGFDIRLTIKPYNYLSDTFRAVEFRLWAQRLSNELIISSNDQLRGLARFDQGNNVDSTIIYEKNNINEAVSYLPSNLNKSNYKLAWIGYEVENGSAINENSEIPHVLVKKYAGETNNLYITEEEHSGNKVLQKLAVVEYDNPSYNLGDYLRAISDIDEWDGGSITIKKKDLSTKSISSYLAGYAVQLPKGVKGKLDFSNDTPLVISHHKFMKITGNQQEDSVEYDFNWYNENAFSAGDNIITSERGNPNGNYYVYSRTVVDSGSMKFLYQIRNTDRHDRELITTKDSLVKINANKNYYIKRVSSENIVGNRDEGIHVYTSMEDEDDIYRDITEEIDWRYSKLCWDSSKIPSTLKNWLLVSLYYNGVYITGDDTLVLDSKDFTFIDSNGYGYEFSTAEYERTIGYYRFSKYRYKEGEYSRPVVQSNLSDVYTTRTVRTDSIPLGNTTYWVCEHKYNNVAITGIAFPVDPEHPDNPYVKVEEGGTTTVNKVNHIDGTRIYVRPVSSMSDKSVKYQKTALIDGSTSTISFAYKYEIVCDNGNVYTPFNPYSSNNQSFVIKATWACEPISSTSLHFHLDPDYYYNGDLSGLNWSTFNSYDTSIQASNRINGIWSKNSRVNEWGYYTAAMDFLSSNDEFEIENSNNTYTVRITPNESGTRASMWYWGTDSDHVNLYTATIQKDMLPDPTTSEEDTEAVHKGIILQGISSNYVVLSGYIPVIIAACNVDSINVEIAYLFLKSEVYSTKGVVNSGDFDKVFVAPSSSGSNNFTFTVSKSNRFQLYPDPVDGQDSFSVSNLSDALTTYPGNGSYQAAGGTVYCYPYYDGDAIQYIKSANIIREGNKIAEGSGFLRELWYYKTTNKWYPPVFCVDKVNHTAVNEEGIQYDNCPPIIIKTAQSYLFGLYEDVDNELPPKWLIAEKISSCYMDFYKTNTKPTTTYIAQSFSENPIYERKTYTYEDYQNSRYSLYQYFDWFNCIFFEKDSSELDGSPYQYRVNDYTLYDPEVNMLDGVSNLEGVVNLEDPSNISQLQTISSGYRYTLFDVNGQRINYYALNSYLIDNREAIFFSDPICTKRAAFSLSKVDNDKIHAINFVKEQEIITDLNTDYAKNGMGFPRKKGLGSKYLIELTSNSTSDKNIAFLGKVIAGDTNESASKIVVLMESFVRLIPPDRNNATEVELSQFGYNGYYYQLGNSNYYLYTGSSVNMNVPAETSPYKGDRLQLSNVYKWLPDSTLEDKYFDIWMDNQSDDPELPKDPSIGLVFEFDGVNLSDRPKTNLMYPVSTGLSEDYQPIYHIDRTEFGRSANHYIDYAVLDEPKVGMTVDLYTVDYDKVDKTRKRIDGWDIKPVKTNKTISFNSISSLPSNELKLFEYRYTTDSETRIFLPLPDRLRQDEIITENFIGNPEKDLSVIIKNPQLKVVVPDYNFQANGGTLKKELSITKGYLIKEYQKNLPEGWSCKLGEINGEPDPNYWSSYVGYEEKYLEYTLPDRYDPHKVTGGINIDKEVVNFGNDQYYTKFKALDGTESNPTYKITQAPVFYGINLSLVTEGGAVLLEDSNWIETTELNNPIQVSDTTESIVAEKCRGIIYNSDGYSFDDNAVSIQVMEDLHKIIKSIDPAGTSGRRIYLNRNKTREDRKCVLRFTNTSDSNTTALIVEIIQKAIIPTLELYYNYESNNIITDEEVYFGADGILKNPTDENGKNDGVLFVRTNLLNDIVDSSLITLKQRKEMIYRLLRLTMASNDPIFYEISIINSSKGDLYYTGDGYDDVYRVYKLVNVSKLPNIDVRNIPGIGLVHSTFKATCEIRRDIEDDSSVIYTKTVPFNCAFGTFRVIFTKCTVNTSGASYIVASGSRENEGSIKYNSNVTSPIRPSDYSNSKYKTERNPDVFYLLENNQPTAFMEISHGNELSGGWEYGEDGTFNHIPLNYLKVIRYEGTLKSRVVSGTETENYWDSNDTQEMLLDNLIISNTIDIKQINSQEDYSSILQGVLNEVSYGNSPDTITLGSGNTSISFHVKEEDEGFIKLLKYKTVNSENYSIRNTISLEYRDRTLRYPFKCELIVYFDLVD